MDFEVHLCGRRTRTWPLNLYRVFLRGYRRVFHLTLGCVTVPECISETSPGSGRARSVNWSGRLQSGCDHVDAEMWRIVLF